MPIIGVALLMLLAGHGDFYHQWRLNWLEPVWAVGLAIAWGTRRKRPGLWQWGVMLVSACAAAWSQSEFRLQRPAHHVFRYLSAYAQPMAGDIVTWTDPWTARFLNRSGDVQLLGPEAFLEWVALHPAGAPPGTGIYVISHAAASPPKQSTDAAGSLLEYLVGRTPGVVAYPIERDWGEWKQIWRVMPDVCPAIAEQHALGMRQIEEMRQVEGAEQVLLASDLPFDSGGSFGQLEWTGDLRPQRWTLDNAPSLRWRAPERTGRYLLRVEGMRPHPLPTEVSLLRYRLPGAREWREMPMAVGPVEFEGEIEVTKPGEWLELQLELISWQPWFYISGSTDARALGIILSRVSLIPLDR